jgi:RimJ/RimL family protein N-acetyltransferase
VRNQHRLLRCRDGIERRPFAAMRDIDCHPHGIHSRHHRLTELRQAPVSHRRTSRAETVLGVISHLREALAHLVKRIEVVEIAQMVGILHSEDNADFPLGLRPREIGASIDAQETGGVLIDEPVPLGEPRLRDRVGPGVFERDRRMEYVDPGVLQLAEIGFAEVSRSALPMVEKRPVKREQAEHVDHVRLRNQVDCAGRIIRRAETIENRGRKHRHAAAEELSSVQFGIPEFVINYTPSPGQRHVPMRHARRPGRISMEGRWVLLEPIELEKHAEALWQGSGGTENEYLWRYMHDGPFLDREAFDEHLRAKAASEDPLLFAIVDRGTGVAVGRAQLMRIDPPNRVIEIGGILYTRVLQRSRGATEAMYLFARYVFEDLGYRRYEWKCNTLNEASRRAALRLGFTFEGVFRQHMIVKGKSRDTAWFSMLDSEWPERKRIFERWLDDNNFDSDGRQKTRLNA